MPVSQPAMSKGSRINVQLAQLAKLLGATVSSSHAKDMEVESAGLATTSQNTGSAPCTDRTTLVHQLKAIEAALSHLPEGDAFEAARAPLIAQASELKRKITNTKPLSARLEGCWSAFERARKRQEVTNDAVAVALKAQDAANLESKRLEAELAELEKAVAADQQQTAKTSCLERLQVELKLVVAEMQQSSNVAESDMKHAMTQMETLFSGLVKVSEKALAVGSTQNPSVLEMLQILAAPGVASLPPVPLAPDAQNGFQMNPGAVFPGAAAATGWG